MKKLNNEALNVTSDQLSKDQKLKQYLNTADGKKTPVNIVDKTTNSATATNSTSPTTTTIGMTEEAPMTQAPIKVLSNLKDSKTGEVSQPFVIDSKKYQMVRGRMNGQEIQAVYSYDDIDEGGQNKVYTVEEFDATIARPMLERERMTEEQPAPNQDAEAINYLNVDDMAGSKHFFVNKNTGEVIAKFPNTRDMIKSGISLSEDEEYMDSRALRRHRLRKMLGNEQGLEEDVNLGKLQQDVKKLSKLIKDKFVIALEKINTPLEQSQFLVAMANEIGVPFTKLSTIINSFKEISKDQDTMNSMTSLDSDVDTSTTTALQERRIITKNELLESISRPVLNRIKVKDIK